MKRILKSIFVPLLASRPVTAIANRILHYGVPVFMLHRIAGRERPDNGGLTPDHLRSCLDYLRRNAYSLISLQQLVTALKNRQPLPPKPVVFTMDDGFMDQADFAAPVFLEYDCPLTFFVITGMLNGDIWPWDAQISWIMQHARGASLTMDLAGRRLALDISDRNDRQQARRLVHNILREVDAVDVPGFIRQLAAAAGVVVPEKPPASFMPMNWDTARRLEGRGIDFAPHSVTHNILSRLSRETMISEINTSWKTLEQELAKPVKVFCYPTGRYSDFGTREIAILRESGFLGAVTSIPEYVEPGSKSDQEIYTLPRFALPNDMKDFIQYCTWIEYFKHRMTAENRGY